MSLDNITTHDTARADTAVVRTLRSGETALRPAIRTAINAHKRVLLLNTEPALLVLALLKDLRGVVAVVGLVRCAIIVVALGQNEHIVAATEGIREVRHGAEVHVRVVTRSLARRRTVKVPLLEVRERPDGTVTRGSLGARHARGIEPHVLGCNLAVLRQAKVRRQQRVVLGKFAHGGRDNGSGTGYRGNDQKKKILCLTTPGPRSLSATTVCVSRHCSVLWQTNDQIR